ncbi:hypothetical protein V5N11_006183 [Cardamine amara subsp. amara]|uniref:DUF4378 domain-containing protein n=1 Tax=Cardamine amara subsp. amara TaxID=228776 RepID=A0ABD1AEJ9_CARAN
MASISSSDHRFPVSKKRLKPLSLRDYLLDDLSSCSSNGFKSFPRHQSSSTVRRLFNAEIKRSGLFHHSRRLTCGLTLTHAVHKASTALLSAFKFLPLPSSVKSPSIGLFSTRNFWMKPSRRKLNVDGENERKMKDSKQKIQRLRSFGDFLLESQDQPMDSFSGGVTLSNAAGESSSFSNENSEVTQSSSGVAVMKSGECVGSHVSDGSSINDIREECVNEEKELLSPISILECPFEDDAISTPSHQKETNEKRLTRKSRRFESLVRLEPVDLEKRIKQCVERQEYFSHIIETEEDQSENRANRLFALVKSRVIEEPNHLLVSHVVDNVLLDFFKEDGNKTRDEDKLVKIVEEWVMRRQEEECMFMSWEVKEKRVIYVKEMKWGCIKGDDQREYVVEELGNGFVTSLIDELILDLSL